LSHIGVYLNLNSLFGQVTATRSRHPSRHHREPVVCRQLLFDNIAGLSQDPDYFIRIILNIKPTYSNIGLVYCSCIAASVQQPEPHASIHTDSHV
jgi:hypothetical protein